MALEQIRTEYAENGRGSDRVIHAYTENRISAKAFWKAINAGMKIYNQRKRRINKMSEEERDWMDEEKALITIYRRRGYTDVTAIDMALREIEKRKIECGYAVYAPKKEDKEVSGRTKSKKEAKKQNV